jgi:hypothetical protein
MTYSALANGSPGVRRRLASDTPATRSRISNRGGLEGIDGRSAEARRYRDVITDLTRECGGDIGHGQLLLIQAIARNVVAAEQMTAAKMRGDAISSDDIVRANNAVERGLNRLRRSRTPDAKAPTLAERLMSARGGGAQ